MFDINLKDVNQKLREVNYISNKEIEYAIFTAIKAKKPLLIDGPAGVGKTDLAKVLSKIFNAELIRLQCYEGIDVSKVIYDINYPKQLLYQNILKETITFDIKGKSFEESIQYLDKNTNFYGDDFLIERPILHAINPKNKNNKVLLIDELDKADSEIEAFLLEALSDYSVSIPEYGTIHSDLDNLPLVVITSNNERELSKALKRRCTYLYIDYPSIELESDIIKLKANTSKEFANVVANFMHKIRNNLKLKNTTSVAESIEWANILFNYFGVDDLSKKFEEEIIMTLNLISKDKKDIEKIKTFVEDDFNGDRN